VDRRNFLKMLVGGVAATAAVRTFPFRVFSFPSEPKIFTVPELKASLKQFAESIDVLLNPNLQEASVEAIELESFAKDMPLIFPPGDFLRVWKTNGLGKLAPPKMNTEFIS